MEISKIKWLMIKIIRLFKIVLPVSFYLVSISLNAQLIERKDCPVIIDFEKVIKTMCILKYPKRLAPISELSLQRIRSQQYCYYKTRLKHRLKLAKHLNKP